MARPINAVVLVKGEERYVFFYDDDHVAETLSMLGQFASRSDLSLTWYDAARLSQKIREQRRVGHDHR
jgi:hypothetical protein